MHIIAKIAECVTSRAAITICNIIARMYSEIASNNFKRKCVDAVVAVL